MMDNWFVTYAFDEDGQLEVYLSDDYEGLRAEDSKLKTIDMFPSDAWMFLQNHLESNDGILFVFAVPFLGFVEFT